jgi:hypothetical protein
LMSMVIADWLGIFHIDGTANISVRLGGPNQVHKILRVNLL